MNKWVTVLLSLALLATTGCKKSSPTQPNVSLWNVQALWPRGTHPVPAPVGNAVLFLQEESPAGLYLLQNGNATQVNPSGPDARADYAWSDDGTRFCFSSPGVVGGPTAGIYLGSINAPSTLQRLWDRGTHPRFLPGNEGIICAGPEDTTASSGLWQLMLSGGQPQRLIPEGVEPEISPDGGKIAYLLLAGIDGRTLIVIDRETTHSDTVAGQVFKYAWLSDSQSLVIEAVSTAGAQQIATTSLSGGAPHVVDTGSDPAAFPSGNSFVYTALAGDRLDGLRTASPGFSPTRITSVGAVAVPASANRIVAQDSTGLLEITH